MYLLKFIKIRGNLTKLWQKQKCTVFWDAVYILHTTDRYNCIFAVYSKPIIIIIKLIISKTMFMVLSSWQSRCESSPGLFDECRTAPSGRRPKTKPDDLGCESACTGCQNLHPYHRHLLLLLSPKADTHFTVPQRVEGWVDIAHLWYTMYVAYVD